MASEFMYSGGGTQGSMSLARALRFQFLGLRCNELGTLARERIDRKRVYFHAMREERWKGVLASLGPKDLLANQS
jgi:hypothetical protein